MASLFGVQGGGSFVKVTGLHETMRKLEKLGEKGFPVARSAAGLSMTPVKKAIVAAAPESDDPGHGALKEAIIKKQKGYRKDGGVFVAVGVDKKFTKASSKKGIDSGQKVPMNYLHLVELTGAKSHWERGISKGRPSNKPPHPYFSKVKHPGITAKHFMQKTFDSMHQATINLFTKKFSDKFNKEISKMAAK